MTGRKKMNNELSRELSIDKLDSCLRIGIRSRYGMPLNVELTFFCVSPPTMMVYPSGTVTREVISLVCLGGGTPAEPGPVNEFKVTM